MGRLVLLVVLAVLLVPAPASAHGQLAESVPAHQSTVTAVLSSVTLSFSEAPPASATFAVTSPSGISLLRGWSHGQPAPLRSPVQELNLVNGSWQPVYYKTGFPAVLSLSHLPELGVYTVTYAFSASDGDKVSGSVRFDYQGPMTTAPPVDMRQPAASSSPLAWLWWTAIAGIVLGGVAYLLHRRRPPRARAAVASTRTRSTRPRR